MIEIYNKKLNIHININNVSILGKNFPSLIVRVLKYTDNTFDPCIKKGNNVKRDAILKIK